MSVKNSLKGSISFAILIGVLFFGVGGIHIWRTGGVNPVLASEAANTQSFYYLPTIVNRYPWLSPFGVEAISDLGQNSTRYQRAIDLRMRWVRLNERISWRKLQLYEGGPIAWNTLAPFENELRALASANMTPLVIVDDYPYWSVQIVRKDGKPTSCGPLKAEKFLAFAQFMRELVKRYQTPEFNVHHWELGNEPDVAPDLVGVDSVFGCWGNVADPYYGGAYYGEMLKTVAPVIRAEDPNAKIWVGGLLLDSPQTNDPNKGHPELFFRGILQSGAASSFDVVPYHSYPSYLNIKMDYDLDFNSSWSYWGGGTVGKARFLRQTMQAYNVSKPVVLNETGLGCPYDWLKYAWCNPPDLNFFQMQGDYLARSFTRGLTESISSLIWYTLESPGWRYTALLDPYDNPKPAYNAFQNLSLQLQNSHYTGPAAYGPEIEAYNFQRGTQQIQIVWTKADTSLVINVPETGFTAAYTRDGTLMSLTPSNGYYQVPVGFSPIYILRTP